MLIIGGGPAGMTAAITLARAGIEVQLAELERDWRPAGIGLLLQSPPLRALRAIGLLEPCLAAGFPHPEVTFCDASGGILYTVTSPAGLEDLPPVAIARPALHTILEQALREAGVVVKLGVTVEQITQSPHAAEVLLTDGTRASYDLVVGADGLHSAVRRIAFPDAPVPASAGQAIWRALAPRPPSLRHYPIYLGPGGKIGLVPLSDTDMYIYLLQNGSERRPRPDRSLLPAMMREQLGGYNGLVDEVRAHLVPDSVDYRGLSALLVPPPWHRGRVLLIGDAAHATTPHLAFGVGIALEDGIVLGELAAAGGPAAEVLREFMTRRYERARLIVENSLQLARWEVTPVPDADPAALVRATFEVMAQPI